jgi:UDP-glucose 4-epimerase
VTKPVLVFGGAGFVGRATCRALEERGFQPVVADVVSEGGTWPEHFVNIGNRDEVTALIADVRPTAVVNLAYRLADACENDLDGAFQVNVVGSQNVIETCREHGVGRYIYASSIAVYGDQSTFGEHRLVERDQGRPVRLYGWHKLLQEEIAERYRDQGLNCAGLRISTVFGPGRRAGLSAAVNAFIDPDPLVTTIECPWSSEEAFDLIHVDDVAIALATLVAAPILEWSIYNSGGEFATIGTLAQSLLRRRPDVRVIYPSEPATLAHCSLINWDRLKNLLAEDRRSLADRVEESRRE